MIGGEGAQGVRARGGPLASTPFGSRASAAERPRDGFSDVARGALGGADPKRGVAFEHVCRVLDDGGVRSEARGRPSSRARRRPGEARIDSRGAHGGRRLRSRGDCDRVVLQDDRRHRWERGGPRRARWHQPARRAAVAGPPRDATGVRRPSSRDALSDWLRAHGAPSPSGLRTQEVTLGSGGRALGTVSDSRRGRAPREVRVRGRVGVGRPDIRHVVVARDAPRGRCPLAATTGARWPPRPTPKPRRSWTSLIRGDASESGADARDTLSHEGVARTRERIPDDRDPTRREARARTTEARRLPGALERRELLTRERGRFNRSFRHRAPRVSSR